MSDSFGPLAASGCADGDGMRSEATANSMVKQVGDRRLAILTP